MNPAASTVALIFGAVVISGLAWAQQGEHGGPTPSPQGAAVHFVGLNDGAKLPTRVTIRFGLRDMGVAPAGLERANSGHHHLLIDTELPPLDKPIPNDFNHLHFGAGQTEAEVTLKPGPHTLQLLFIKITSRITHLSCHPAFEWSWRSHSLRKQRSHRPGNTSAQDGARAEVSRLRAWPPSTSFAAAERAGGVPVRLRPARAGRHRHAARADRDPQGDAAQHLAKEQPAMCA
jgi:hypothetical protein